MLQIIHDYGHVGLTNDFLIASSAPLAISYNDRSPLESYHCAAAFTALQKPELNFIKQLPRPQIVALRKQVRANPCPWGVPASPLLLTATPVHGLQYVGRCCGAAGTSIISMRLVPSCRKAVCSRQCITDNSTYSSVRARACKAPPPPPCPTPNSRFLLLGPPARCALYRRSGAM